MKNCLLLALSIFLFPFLPAQNQDRIAIGKDMRITKISPNAWIHETTMTAKGFGKFWCNGLVFIEGKECLVFDTPASDSLTVELINWLEKDNGLQIKGIVGNHYHADCIEGLDEFHKRGIPSYSSRRTAKLAAEDSMPIPQVTFKRKMKMELGDKVVQLYYPGHAHSPDNIVAYVPSERVLFGGCMVKSKKAGKGYLGVADVEEWPKTLDRVRKRFGDAEYVIPGHGKYGGLDLFEDTVRIVTAPDK